MADPFTSDKDWHLTVKLDLAHLEWRCVPMTHEIADKTAVLRKLFGTLPIRYASGLYDAFVPAHVVHEPDETMIQDRDFLFKHLLHLRVRYSLGISHSMMSLMIAPMRMTK